jgi:hypothetical protein
MVEDEGGADLHFTTVEASELAPNAILTDRGRRFVVESVEHTDYVDPLQPGLRFGIARARPTE